MSGATLAIVVQPPSAVRVGDVLNPPLALKVTTRGVVNGGDSLVRDFDRVWAFATLINESGETVGDSLGGTVADSVHSFSGEESFLGHRDGYFLFDNLSIQNVGVYRIRITLMRMDASGSEDVSAAVGGAASLEQVESRRVRAVDSDVPHASPSHDEQTFLDSLPVR